MNTLNVSTKSVLAASLSLLTSALSSGKSYTLEILNINYSDTDAAGLNNNGQIVGTAYNNDGKQKVAFRYDNLTKTCSVVVPPASFMNPAQVIGTAINSAGTIVGIYSHPPLPKNLGSFIFYSGFGNNPNGATYSLDDYQDGLDHEVIAIKDNGLILETETFLFNPSGPSTYLRNGFGDKLAKFPVNFFGTAMNESLSILGTDNVHTWLYNYSTGQATTLQFPGKWGRASAINKLGMVGGIVTLPNDDQVGFLASGSWHLLFGTGVAAVTAMNNVADVVGELQNGGRPFIYESSTGYFLDLNKQLSQGGWTLQTATGINDFGQICGRAYRSARFGEPSEGGFIYKAYILTPITPGGIIPSPPVIRGAQ